MIVFERYESLFRQYRNQDSSLYFAHFYPKTMSGGQPDYDAPFIEIAKKTYDSLDAWYFQQDKFKTKNAINPPPKLRNYLNYTFKRLCELEKEESGKYFIISQDENYIGFNTGLQDSHLNDLYMIFQKNTKNQNSIDKKYPDWIYRATTTSSDPTYYTRNFGNCSSNIAWYSDDSRDYVFNTKYHLDTNIVGHTFSRAKERSGFDENCTDDVVRTYLDGALHGLIPKINRNYKTAIPMYYVEDKKMQLLLPFPSVNSKDISCFLVERDDDLQRYTIKTVLDMDQAYYCARLITRPDKEWLNP